MKFVRTILLLMLFLLLTLPLYASEDKPAVSNCKVQQQGPNAHRLVVLLHGIANIEHRMDDVRDSILAAMPDADLLAPVFSNRIYASDDPRTIAASIAECITRVFDPKYSDVVLVGYSAGGLFLRKAYLISRGYSSDDPNRMQRVKEEWGSRVSRIVLLAGMNRGWSIDPAPANMSWFTRFKIRAANALTPASVGGLIKSLRRGAPFVVDLQIDWMRMAEEAREAKQSLPITIQLLGDKDDIVSTTDSIDLESGAAFIYKRLPDPTTHMNAVNFSGDVGHLRKRVFLDALTTPAEKLAGDYLPEAEIVPDFSTTDVVFVVHGIRDPGADWTAEIARQLEGMKPGLKAIPSSYGYFSMGKFLLDFEREKNVRWMMDEYTAAMARYPKAKFSFIGHSNGTFLLAQALRNYPACRFERAALAGSVMPANFPWHNTGGKINTVRNYVATADYVVGVFPHLYEVLRPDMSNIGGAGFVGFYGDDLVRKEQVTYVIGGHGAALAPGVMPNIISFILQQPHEAQISRDCYATAQSRLAVWSSKLCWLAWLLLLAILVGIGWLLTHLTRHKIFAIRLSVLQVYIGLLIVLLNTI
jgi:pimeloyl-ACP methyl ester carboxylesterase